MKSKDELITSPRAQGQRAGLDLEQILEAARSFRPEDLSLSALALKLKVDRKALSYYVKDRKSLFQLLAIEAFNGHFSGLGVEEAVDWQSALKAYAETFVSGIINLGAFAEHIWFGDPLTMISLDPVEALFAKLKEAGFSDEDSVRLVTMLSTVCLGHARDILTYRNNKSQSRPIALRGALDKLAATQYENLHRIIELGVNTYSVEQLDFEMEIILNSASRLLAAK